MLRKAKHEAGANLFEADEVNRILDAADPILRAMTCLAIDTGCENTDIGNLPKSALDFVGGWLDYTWPWAFDRRQRAAIRGEHDGSVTPRGPVTVSFVPAMAFPVALNFNDRHTRRSPGRTRGH